MRDLFPGYYRPSEEEFSTLWKNCVFILDTNVLLNLYRYNEESRTDFIHVLRKIEDQLWIPHQVALEFQENRITVIKDQEKKFDSIKYILDNNQAEIKKDLSKFPSVKHEVLINKIGKLFEDFLQEIKHIDSESLKLNQHDAIRQHDTIRDIVDDLFKNKVGEPPTEQELKNIETEGEKRYSMKYPPGFKDQPTKKKEPPYLCNGMAFKREYGDLILWQEILKEAKTRNWPYVIFITDDTKEDWWRIEKGETISPRPELIEEICQAGVSIFYMYTPERFLKFAQEYIKVDVKEESIQLIEEISAIKNDLLYKNLMGQGLKQTERAVSRWLESEYPDDEIIQSSNREIDLLHLTKNNLSIGYKIKSTSFLSTFYHARKILRYVQEKIDIVGYLTTKSELAIDEFYLVVVVNNIIVHNGDLTKLILHFIKPEFMTIKSSLRSQYIEMGLIIGGLYVTDINDEFPEIRFEKSWDSRDK